MAKTTGMREIRHSQDVRNITKNPQVYIEGTAARQLEQPIQQPRKDVSTATRRNRERALQMNFGYVTFLAAAAVLTVFVCVNFLQLRAKGTLLQKEVTRLETKLGAAVLENDSDYARIMTNVDMEHVKFVAMNELGMTYAKKSQIVTYELDDNDYVRQYNDVPTE